MKKAEAISILATSVRPREAKDRARYDKAVKMAIEALNCSEFPNNSDTISRQAAIDALDGEIEITGRTNAEAVKGYVRLVKDRLERLPSAQPDLSSYSDKLWRNAYERGRVETEAEIIYCKDCVHHIDGFFCQVANHHTSDKDCCASVFGAERREE